MVEDAAPQRRHDCHSSIDQGLGILSGFEKLSSTSTGGNDGMKKKILELLR